MTMPLTWANVLSAGALAVALATTVVLAALGESTGSRGWSAVSRRGGRRSVLALRAVLLVALAVGVAATVVRVRAIA